MRRSSHFRALGSKDRASGRERNVGLCFGRRPPERSLPAQTGLASPRGVPGLRPKPSGPRACVGRGPPRRGLTRAARAPAPPPPAPRGLVAPPPGRWGRPPLIGRARASVLVAFGPPQRERSAAARPVRLGCWAGAGRRPDGLFPGPRDSRSHWKGDL